MQDAASNGAPDSQSTSADGIRGVPQGGSGSARNGSRAGSARRRRGLPFVALMLVATVLFAVVLVVRTRAAGPDRPVAHPVARVGADADVRAPATATVTGSTEGIAVSPQRIRASPDGIHLRTVNAAKDPGLYLNFRGGNFSGGGDPVPLASSTKVLTLPPGKLDLSCTLNNGTQEQHIAVVVVDPLGQFQVVDVRDTLGCEPDHGVADGPSLHGPTPQIAAQALAASLGHDPTLVRGGGYLADALRPFLVRAGDTRGQIGLERSAAGGFSASLSTYC